MVERNMLDEPRRPRFVSKDGSTMCRVCQQPTHESGHGESYTGLCAECFDSAMVDGKVYIPYTANLKENR